MDWFEVVFYLATILVFIAWFFPGVALPFYRWARGSGQISRITAYLVFSLSTSLTLSAWESDSVDTAAFQLALAPLTIPLLLLSFGFLVEYWTCAVFVFAVVAAATAFAATLLAKGYLRLGAAVVLPVVAISLPLLVQSQISDAEMRRKFEELGGTCIDAKSFLKSYRAPGLNSFHAVARREDELFNWSYKSHSWEPIPPDERSEFFEYSPTGSCELE